MTLTGKRVLLVEDEAIISMLLENFLQELGCDVVSNVASLSEGLAVASRAEFDLAVLDVNLDGELSYPIALALINRQVPFLFATGYGVAGLPAVLAHAPVLTKPFSLEQLAAALHQTALAGGGPPH